MDSLIEQGLVGHKVCPYATFTKLGIMHLMNLIRNDT